VQIDRSILIEDPGSDSAAVVCEIGPFGAEIEARGGGIEAGADYQIVVAAGQWLAARKLPGEAGRLRPGMAPVVDRIERAVIAFVRFGGIAVERA
jgi:hypothetical protein